MPGFSCNLFDVLPPNSYFTIWQIFMSGVTTFCYCVNKGYRESVNLSNLHLVSNDWL